MINVLKRTIGHFPFLKKLLLPFYLASGSMVYWIYKSFNLSFSYSLADKSRVEFFPNGQVAKGIFLGGFEKKELEIFQLFLKPGSVLIDAGANIGLYSIIGSRLVGTSGKVYSFEPSKENFNLFLKNIELNKSDNILSINKGLGDKAGESLVLLQNHKTGDAEKYILTGENNSTATGSELNKEDLSETIILDSLDNFQLQHDIKKVDFLKIDVEGYEYYLLKGAENLLKNNPDIVILFECADHLAKRACSSQSEVFTFLNNLGIEIIYWNEQEKKWNVELGTGINTGQLLGGRDISSKLNKLIFNESNNSSTLNNSSFATSTRT
ncbi:MAG TPA: FkbM family methyltransferase [Hanamia sp.]